jgi:hypothetical protein
VDKVVDAILGIYQTLLGVTFQRMTDGPVWHEDVQLFSVWNSKSTQVDATPPPATSDGDNGFLGYLYLVRVSPTLRFPFF